MVNNAAKIWRAALAGILFPMILLLAGGYATFAQTPDSSQSATNTAGAYPATYDQFKAQDAANEKNSHSIQNFGLVAIVAVGALVLFRRWYLRD